MAKETLITLNISRTADGITLTATSPQLEEFFASASGGKKKKHHLFGRSTEVQTGEEGGEAVFEKFANRSRVYAVSMGEINDLLLHQPDRPFIDRDGNVNLAFLRCEGIGEGLTLRFREHHSEEAIKKAMKTLQRKADRIYSEYLEPISMEVEIEVNENDN